jgi:hypothetical protein
MGHSDIEERDTIPTASRLRQGWCNAAACHRFLRRES